MKIRLTKRAVNDLERIAEYTELNWGKIQRDEYLSGLEQRFHWLAENPGLGIDRSDIAAGYYCYPQGRHLIFFLRTEDSLDIIGIPHQEMDVFDW